jgi:hypothetical protein
MANIDKKSKRIGQPEIMVAETVIGRDCVTFSLPKRILSQISLNSNQAYFCVTNGVIQISGDIPAAQMPIMVLSEESFLPQGNA